jgi:hypothetical protein
MELVTSFLTPLVDPLSPLSTPASIEMFCQLCKAAVKFVEKNKSSDTNRAKRRHDALILERFPIASGCRVRVK